MVLETATEQTSNLRELVIPEPQKGGHLRFDLREFCTPEDVREIRENLPSLPYREFVTDLSNLKILGLSIPTEQDIDWPEFGAELSPERGKYGEPIPDFVARSVIAFPGQRDWIINQAGKDAIREAFAQTTNLDYKVQSIIFEVAVMFPNEYRKMVRGRVGGPATAESLLTEDSIVNISQDWQENWRQTLFYRDGAWVREPHNFMRVLARAQALLPYTRDVVEITPDQWKLFGDWLKKYKEEREWSKFLELAAHMKMFVADEVKITDEGLEITMDKKSDENPPLPEVKEL